MKEGVICKFYNHYLRLFSLSSILEKLILSGSSFIRKIHVFVHLCSSVKKRNKETLIS